MEKDCGSQLIKNKETMKVNFKELDFKDLEGNVTPLDVTKQLANFIYSETKDIEYAVLAQDIYKNGEVELTDEQIEKIKEFLSLGFKAFVQIAFNNTIERLKSETKEIKD